MKNEASFLEFSYIGANFQVQLSSDMKRKNICNYIIYNYNFKRLFI